MVIPPRSTCGGPGARTQLLALCCSLSWSTIHRLDPMNFPPRAQRAERERLHRLIERLANWDNSSDLALFEEARAEILRSSGGRLPAILDPFAGGGTIPLEAQRLGLEATASDLNPVAVLINKALLDIPWEFRGKAPAYPELAVSEIRTWQGLEGLAADVRAYGEWIGRQARTHRAHVSQGQTA